jgi:uncharacterized protein
MRRLAGRSAWGRAAPARSVVAALGLALLIAASTAGSASAHADAPLPRLTEPVNDFAHVLDQASANAIDRTIRALQAATGDTIIVATIETYQPYGDLQEYANKLFENLGRGIGTKGKDNGLLITVATRDHQVWVEVGYGLEEYITDGFAGETSRLYMIPHFRQGDYGAGLEAGVQRIAGRLAEARGVALTGVPVPAPPRRPRTSRGGGLASFIFIIALILVGLFSSIRRGPRGPGRWGRGPWSGWSSGIGPFGGGWGGGFGGFGGGFGGGRLGGGGGFGGFGGGRSGGGGGGGGW